jgi:hypothetical protein
VLFGNVDFSGTDGGEGDSVGENAVNEEFLFARARKGKEVLGNIRRCRILWSFGLVNRGVTQPSPLH